MSEIERKNRDGLIHDIERAVEIMLDNGNSVVCLPHMFIGDDEFSKVTITIEKPEEGN